MGGKPSSEFEKNHESILKEVSNAFVVAGALQSQVYWYYNVDKSKQASMFDEFSKLKTRVLNTQKFLDLRYRRKYAGFFVHPK